MRKFLVVALIATLTASVIVGCGSGGGGGSSEAASFTKEPVADKACERKPVAGGSLVYARAIETVSLDPLQLKNGNGDIFAEEMIYTGLVRNDPTGPAKIVPGLAESWKVSPDKKIYTFKLRPGIKFSDGTPITASDVAWNLERFADPETNPIMTALAVGIVRVKATNPTTVQVELARPISAFLYNISIFPAFIVPKAKVEREGAAFWNHPVGSGPWMVKEWVKGDHITFERNPYWYEKGKPYLETMRWNFITDSNTRILSLKSGEAQIADGVPFNEVEALQKDSNLVVQPVDIPQYLVVGQNTKAVPGLADLNVRRAINYATDREQINQVVFKGLGSIPNSALPPFEMDASDKQIPPLEFNLEKAKEEMAASAFPQGFSMTFQYPAGLTEYKQVALLLQQQLAAIGISLKLEELEAGTVAERWTSGEYEFDIPYPGTTSDIPVPDEYAAFYATEAAEINGFESFWHDNETEAKVEKFLTTSSPKARETQWHEIQAELLDQSPTLNVLNIPLVLAHDKNVCGTVTNANGVDQLQEAWIAQ